MAIFAAIAGFTDGEWSFNIPLLGVLFANTGVVPTMFIATLLAVAFSIIGVLSINKITDANALKKSWQCVAKVFCALGIIYAVSMLAVALYSLMGAGKKSGLSHEDLWLSCFLPNLIMALTAGGMFFLARAIANGKTALLRILGIVSVIVAGIGLVLVVIQTLVNFYGETKSNSIYDYDWSDLWDY